MSNNTKSLGCRYCGKTLDEINAGRRARSSGCCHTCYIERFGTADDKQRFAQEQQYERETKTNTRPAKTNPPGRIDSDKVKIKRVIYED
jgi:hypothetical protein